MALPTPEELRYMERHKDDTQVPSIISVCVAGAVIAVMLVALRLWCRRKQRTPLGLDDWLILIALIANITVNTCFALTTRWGGGRHVILLSNPRLFGIFTITEGCFYITTMTFIKLSILAFYARIFPQKWFQWTVWGNAVFMALWGCAGVCGNIFQCIPIQFLWDPTLDGHCIQYGIFATVLGALTVVTDLIILVIPMPLVWKLHITKRKKWRLSTVFAFGGVACIISIVRFRYILSFGSTTDVTWGNTAGGVFSTVELLFGMLAACVPTYQPLFQKFISRVATVTKSERSMYAEFSSGSHSRTRSVKVTAGSGHTNYSANRDGVAITDEIILTTYRDSKDRDALSEEALPHTVPRAI